jgi:hypothetical protein
MDLTDIYRGRSEVFHDGDHRKYSLLSCNAVSFPNKPDVSEEHILSVCRRVIQLRNQKKEAYYCCYLSWFTFDPEDGGHIFLRNVGISPNCNTLQTKYHAVQDL